jgi:hypothetical protein
MVFPLVSLHDASKINPNQFQDSPPPRSPVVLLASHPRSTLAISRDNTTVDAVLP